MRAYDVMTWGVISIGADITVSRAGQLMLENDIRGLPVTDAAGHLIGIVTASDLLRRDEVHACRLPGFSGDLEMQHISVYRRKVCELMTPKPYTIAGDTPLDEIIQLLEQHQIGHLPVLDEDQIIGMVSRANLIRAFSKLSWMSKPPLSEGKHSKGNSP